MNNRYGVNYLDRDALGDFLERVVDDLMPVFPGGWLDMISYDLATTVKEAVNFPDQDDLTWETLEDHVNSAIWELGRTTLTDVGIEAPNLELADALALIAEETGMVDAALSSLDDPLAPDGRPFSRRVCEAVELATYLIAGDLFERWRADVADAMRDVLTLAQYKCLVMDGEED